jgi:hypothetical protein
VRLAGIDIRDVLITGNQMSGLQAGFVCTPTGRADNVWFTNNQVIDCLNYGVLFSTGGTGRSRVYITDNLFDLDPYHKHPLRGANGTWTNLGAPGGVHYVSGGGTVVQRNVFRNLNRDSTLDTAATNAADLWEDNVIEADPVSINAFSTLNKGIGLIRRTAGCRLRHVDSNPASATYGTILTACPNHATVVPTTGTYLTGHYIRKSNPSVSAGKVLLGWQRLTTGAAHVAGTDWTEIYGTTT